MVNLQEGESRYNQLSLNPMQTIFWISAALIGYIFAGYPAIVWVISRFIRKPVKKGDYLPTVTMIIAAYNEASVIKQKIENTIAIDYPREKFEIIVFSDGSTDHTDAIVKSFAPMGIRLLRVEGRVGKTECQNRAVAAATGEVIIFSDANSLYDVNAIVELVKNFADEKVGVVVGELRYLKHGASEENTYWGIEQALKSWETSVGSCLGANGSIYAVRKNLYKNLSPHAISDFIEPFFIRRQGFRVVYEPAAFCIERVGKNAEEFSRKRRIILRALQSLHLISDFLNPFKYDWYSIQLWSHKVIRWFAFIPLITVFIANAFLFNDIFFRIIFFMQIIIYLLAIIGIFSRAKPFAILYYFFVKYIAAVLAVWDWVSGKRSVIWKPFRSNVNA